MRRARTTVATALIVVGMAVAAAAQTPPYLNVTRVVVKPDRVDEWLDIQKQYSAAHKKGGGAWLFVYRNTMGNPFEFLVVSPLENYAQRDGQSFVRKGLGEAELARLSARRNQATESVRTTIDRPLAELSYMKEGSPTPRMLRVNHTRVRPGMGDQYIGLMKELVAGLKKIGVPGFRMRRTDLGGSRNDFYSALPLEKWAELDGPSLATKALGEAGYRAWVEKLNQTISFSEFLLYSFVPEASSVPGQ